MILKSFGCSFVYGSDLSDCTDTACSQLTWPALISKKLNYQYKCYAWPGQGNLYILDQILRELDSQSFFVINWTWSDRFNFADRDNDNWNAILPGDNSKMSEFYFKHLHSQYNDKFSTLSFIKLAIDALEQNNCRYLMTCMDSVIQDQQWHQTPSIAYLQNAVLNKITTFDGLNFLDWSKKNGHPVSKLWHPLEAAHQAASEFLIDKIQP